ncbi:MAG: PilZ domain-containing protein [Treponema sp.]|nr:PilZ domain-containing protein [Treponema sp.]
MVNKRKSARYYSLAAARIPSVSGGEALLRDLSVTGGCMEYTMFADVQTGTEYTLEIIPEAASNVEKFDLTIEIRWIHYEGYACSVGFNILASPKGKLFQRYVDYLAWRSSSQ